MLSKSLLTAIGVCCLLILSNPDRVQAGELIIHNGGAMTILSDSTLLLNCISTTVENGGILTLDGGTIERLGKLKVESGGQYITLSGTVDKCYRSFYVIPGPDGKKAVICL